MFVVFLVSRDLTYKLIPVNLADHTIVITNSNVKHNLNSGEYAVRRSQCEEAAKLLRVSSLRHASLEMLNGEMFFLYLIYKI